MNRERQLSSANRMVSMIINPSISAQRMAQLERLGPLASCIAPGRSTGGIGVDFQADAIRLLMETEQIARGV